MAVARVQMAVAVVRIGCYRAWKRVCGVSDPPLRPHFALVAAGLSGSGKTTLLNALCGEDADGAPPSTNGFAIKAAQLDRVVFDVKELGGSATFRPYWDKYFDDEVDGVVFVIDAAADQAAMDEALAALREVEGHEALAGLPLMVIGTRKDVDGARSADEFQNLVEDALPDVAKRRLFRTDVVTATNTGAARASFNAFTEFYDTDPAP